MKELKHKALAIGAEVSIRKEMNRLFGYVESETINIPGYHSGPSDYDHSKGQEGEYALQRMIFVSRRSILKSNREDEIEVTWHDIEIPVVTNKNRRRPSVDLIGFADSRPVLCELKFGIGSIDAILKGMIELVVYQYWLSENAEDYSKLSMGRKIREATPIEWLSFKNSSMPILVLAANNSFWDDAKKNAKRLAAVRELHDAILETTGLEISTYAIGLSTDYFSAILASPNSASREKPPAEIERWAEIDF